VWRNPLARAVQLGLHSVKNSPKKGSTFPNPGAISASVETGRAVQQSKLKPDPANPATNECLGFLPRATRLQKAVRQRGSFLAESTHVPENQTKIITDQL
jgi:hypothetical protein